MESSKLKVEEKNKLYFNKYQFKCKSHIKGSSYAYYTNDIESYINRIQKWRDDSKRWRTAQPDTYWDEIDTKQIEKLIDWRKENSGNNCTIRIQGDTISVFSNDMDLLHSFKSICPDAVMYQVKALGNDSIFLSRPTSFNYRTFFKGKRVSKDFMESIIDFNKMYYGKVKISPALLRFLENRNHTPYMYMHGSYFIDYTEQSFLTLLHLNFPNMIARTYKLEVRSKN